ncbi:MAG: YaeQ family protein [Oleiphilus sp.]
MALSSTIFKVQLDLSDLNRHIYQSFKLTVARHPSENDQRMMLRLVAFALFADERLSFTKGISTNEEPDLWIKNYSDDVELWLELGQPDEKRIRQACAQSEKVVILSYGDRNLSLWLEQIKKSIERFDKLKIYHIDDDTLKQLPTLVDKNMHLHVSIQDADMFIGNDDINLSIAIQNIS